MKKLTFLFVLTLQALFAQDHWETAVFANDIWRYIVPNSEPSQIGKIRTLMIVTGMWGRWLWLWR